MRHIWAIAAGLAIVGMSVSETFAQQLGGGLGSSSFNSGSLGGAGRSSGMGSSGLGMSSGFGQSGMGQSGSGQSGFGQSGFGQSGANNAQSPFGQQTGIGQNTQNRNTGGRTGLGNAGGRNAGGNRQGMGQNGVGMAGSMATQAPHMARYTVTRIGFDVPVIPRDTIVSSAATTLNAASIPTLANVNVTFEGGVAVLTGQVNDKDDFRRAAALLSLEPGVRSIRNQLQIVEPTGTSTP